MTEDATRRTVTIPELASILGLNVNTVYKHCASGEIRCTKLGKRYIIPRSEVDRLLSVESVPTPS